MNNRRKLRILHVLKSSIYSGAENVVINIMKCLQNDFDMIYVATDGEIRKRLEQEHLPMELLPEFDRAELNAVIKKYQPDIVHAHDFSATVLCAMIPGRFCLISHLHYNPPWVERWNIKSAVYRLCYSRIAKVITVTNKAFESMIFADAYRNKHLPLANPIDKDTICQLASVKKTGEEIPEADLLFVGRMVEQKNPQRFIHLVSLLKQNGRNDIRAWILGDGELLNECRKQVKELGLEGNIELKGFQENPYFFMKQSRLLCITSRWEGFGLVAAEANLIGVPVLSTMNAGCMEVLGEDSPELCATDDDFVEKIELLLSNRREWEQWSQRSLHRAEQFSSIDEYKAALTEIYRNEVTT